MKHLHTSRRLGTTSTLLVVLKLLHTPPRLSPTGLSGPFRHLSLLRCSPLFLRVSGTLGSTLPSSFLASQTTMVFSLNCSLARFYRGIIQSSSDLLYPYVYCRPRSSRWLSCTSPRITGSSSISRWRVTRVPISSLVSPPLVSSLCPRCVLVVSSLCPREVFKVPSRVVATSPSFSHCPLFVKSRPVRNSSILTVSSSYHRCIAYWSSPCCQNNFRTSSLYGHRFITASSRPLHAQLKRCQDITSQSLVYHGLLVS